MVRPQRAHQLGIAVHPDGFMHHVGFDGSALFRLFFFARSQFRGGEFFLVSADDGFNIDRHGLQSAIAVPFTRGS